ncbi:Signal transduction histidine kinase CheA [Tritonibacter mobilis]|uniref:Chemotaxis protein CheA n=1 Tax=Tritonibacter mobilis F1926 TaxID=1265309 RepID=A0A1B1A933_9RHOB|nr:chemotaxis protein CheA [Tritonibacter mobilis]NKX37540.1 chemotaxis protein CheA [Rhodobacteraceae bacterium R_SAG4]PXW79638.1 two-component system chemotaxis sensor kinase CheA [Ruegeria sp. P4]ANP43060.1 chemotaxis protein CheA [Tritonibacter mobilis F1926]KJZ23171.1 chemotaxis protein CheA [Tritonibacter mobilis]MCA2006674.1 chemotaxis protein CheA [Tritonibacter mobilis]
MSGSIQDTFFEECEELLEAMDEGLTAIEGGDHDPEVVNAVFRAVHSIKGGAGAFGLDELVAFAHKFETVFDEVRSNKLELDTKLIQLLLRCSDHLADLVTVSRDGGSVDEEHNDVLIAGLEEYLDEEEEDLTFEPMGLGGPSVPLPLAVEEEKSYEIRFRPLKEMFGTGNEPFFLFQALSELGTLEVVLDETELPGFDAMAMDDSYLAWNLTLTTTEPKSAVEAVFEFVEGLCELSIASDKDAEEEAAALAALNAAFGVPGDSAEPETPAPFDAPAPAEATPMATPQATEKVETVKPESNKSEQRGPKPTLRVDLERVDRLINAVGELIINHSMLAQQIANLDVADLRDVETELEGFKNLARDIQEGVMSIRAQPVKPLFQRMARIVREASSATEKTAKLITEGENTEVDKTVIERLSDPLTHILRNAVDHGIEKPEDREAAGKNRTGEIRLSASHRSGSVCIEIKDNGAGINRPRVKQIAIEKGLIPENADLTDAEIDNLLFLPGFSTAKEVSNLSGRGVGMDVVKNAVTALGGRINVSSTPGKGSTFTIILPLTLAVMDGMVVSVADQTMVVPITSIIETMRGSDDMINSLGADGTLLSIRGNFVPICDVAGALGLRKPEGDKPPGVYLLVETETGQRSALAVDDIHDQRQVVIKSLDGVCGNIPGVAAATILGDGKIAMILDSESIIAASPTSATFDSDRRMSNAIAS